MAHNFIRILETKVQKVQEDRIQVVSTAAEAAVKIHGEDMTMQQAAAVEPQIFGLETVQTKAESWLPLEDREGHASAMERQAGTCTSTTRCLTRSLFQI